MKTTTLQKTLLVSLKVSGICILFFFFISFGFFLTRSSDGEWNYPEFENLEEYQQNGGSWINYYLGYKSIDGYDETIDNGDGTSSNSPEMITDGLYKLFLGIVIFGFWWFLWASAPKDLSYFEKLKLKKKPLIVSLLLSLLPLLVGIQFVGYIIRLVCVGW